jgi:hypothetical protein
METKDRDEVVMDFHMPGTINYPVIVSRSLPDNSNIPIGRIYQNSGDGEGAVIYISADNDGEEICPPTTDWITAENNFEKYAKQLARKEMEAMFMEMANREQEIKKVRINKIKKTIQLDK